MSGAGPALSLSEMVEQERKKLGVSKERGIPKQVAAAKKYEPPAPKRRRVPSTRAREAASPDEEAEGDIENDDQQQQQQQQVAVAAKRLRIAKSAPRSEPSPPRSNRPISLSERIDSYRRSVPLPAVPKDDGTLTLSERVEAYREALAAIGKALTLEEDLENSHWESDEEDDHADQDEVPLRVIEDDDIIDEENEDGTIVYKGFYSLLHELSEDQQQSEEQDVSTVSIPLKKRL